MGNIFDSNAVILLTTDASPGEMNMVQLSEKICIDEDGLVSVTIQVDDKPSPDSSIIIDAVIISENMTAIGGTPKAVIFGSFSDCFFKNAK